MNKFQRFEVLAALVLLVLLALLSIFGAFCGAEKAAGLFNSVPLSVCWVVLTVLLVVGLLSFRRMVRLPSLLLMHLGCIFILAGAMLGSEAGHHLVKKFFGIDKVRFGYMIIYEGTAQNRIISQDDRLLAELPFNIHLKDFRIDYYRGEPYLQAESAEGGKLKIPAEVGGELILDGDGRKLRILRVFENFKISIEDGQKIISDVAGGQSNPAVELEITEPNDIKRTLYVFERFPQMSCTGDGLKLAYISEPIIGVRDYFSDLVLLEGEKQILRKVLEVNHPLHYGGYHFYQHSYDSQKGQYTILTVVSDSGLHLVYSGYLMLLLAVVWHFWFGHIVSFAIGKLETQYAL